MIITKDNNYPRIIMIINDFNELEAKTLLKEIIRINHKSKKEKTFINFHIDLFYLNEYSISSIQKVIDELSQYSFEYVNTIKLYLNKNTSNIMLKSAIYMYKIQYNLPIEYVETEKHIVLK